MVTLFKVCINVIMLSYSKIIPMFLTSVYEKINLLAFKNDLTFRCSNIRINLEITAKNRMMTFTPGIKSYIISNCICFYLHQGYTFYPFERERKKGCLPLLLSFFCSLIQQLYIEHTHTYLF